MIDGNLFLSLPSMVFVDCVPDRRDNRIATWVRDSTLSHEAFDMYPFPFHPLAGAQAGRDQKSMTDRWQTRRGGPIHRRAIGIGGSRNLIDGLPTDVKVTKRDISHAISQNAWETCMALRGLRDPV